MKLYYAPGACSLAPHIALRELGLGFELERVDLHAGRTADGRDFRAINPRGYVPALELDDGSVLVEAPVVLQYLADQRPERALVPACGSRQRYDVQSWLNFTSSELHKSFGPLYAQPPEDQRRALVDRIRGRLAYVDGELGRRPWLVGDTYSVADIYLFVIASWCERFGIDPGGWPSLVTWRDRIAARPAVRDALAAEAAPAMA
jgi:glutathione S-transferase